MTDEEKVWREDVGRGLQALRATRADDGDGETTYMGFREMFAAHFLEGCRLGLTIDDDLLFECAMEARGGSKI